MRGTFLKKSIRSVSSTVVILAVSLTVSAFAISPLLAQNPASENERASKSMSFDAVSIHPTDPNSTELSFGGVENNTFVIRNLPLVGVIVSAFYDRGKVPSGFVETLPKWVREKKFDLTAKVSSADYESLKRETHQSTITITMLQPMLQKMLRERCNLAVHTSKATLHIYSLEVGKNGINPKRMKVSTESESIPSNAIRGGGAWLTTFTKGEDGQYDKRNFYKMTMGEFAEHVSSKTKVINNTGLSARYDFSVELVDSARDVSERFDVSPLGLIWKKVDTVDDEVIIDHIDPPSPN